ncbi:MAG: hypothetical protein AVO35_10175 [Candidatus Aegiribacteria sp. MLS_C]|nr:MAG: hypothetical protein AVO35_10175 [Candidatus Aegiribacteria sp. MLS_C]
MTSSGAAYLLDKAPGTTSRRAASWVARTWGFRKFGHAGTLDPDATGLLMVLMGRATRLSRFFLDGQKTYSFAVKLGLRTDTDDTGGRVLERRSVTGVTQDDIREVLRSFTGSFMQKVPEYSAVRVEGGRAYSMARKGLDPDTPVREVRASGWEILELDGDTVRFSVTVSSGTYVRALARDMGEALGTLGTAFDIRRTAVGGFTVNEASGRPDDASSMLTMAELMREYPAVYLDPFQTEMMSHGTPLPHERTGLFRLIGTGGELTAVAEGDGSFLRPVCVLVEK